MIDDNPPAPDAEAPDGPNGRGDGSEPADPASTEPKSPEVQIAELQEHIQRTREQMLRVAADFDNYRKRMQRELEEARRRAAQNVVKDLLPVFDNVERATSHLDDGTDVKSLADGLRMVRKQLETQLARVGVTRLESVGKPFDPAVHESIQHIESVEHPAGVVVAEVQPGYVMGTDLIRPSMVVVSRGAPVPSPPAADVDGGETGAD